jgi:hypothetical protein
MDEPFFEQLVLEDKLVEQIEYEFPGLRLKPVVHRQVHHNMLKKPWVHECLWILFLRFLNVLKICVSLLPSHSVD